MWAIRDNLYLGEENDGLDRHGLLTSRITHVVNCAREIDCPFPDEFAYLHLPLSDPDSNFSLHIDRACAFICEACSTGAVLVHCQGAVSRSPSMILAYMCSSGLSLREPASELGRVVPTRPNGVFMYQLAEYFDTTLTGESLGHLYELLAGNID